MAATDRVMAGERRKREKCGRGRRNMKVSAMAVENWKKGENEENGKWKGKKEKKNKNRKENRRKTLTNGKPR